MSSKKIHYSRYGYNGDYTYTSVCGKAVERTSTEDISIHPGKANCLQCLNTEEHKNDLSDLKSTKSGIRRRIYIESDILQADEFRDAARAAYNYAKQNGWKVTNRGFSEAIDFAWHDLEKTWNAVKMADEIWATSSLMPLTGGSYNGSPLIFNAMCEKAINENVTGKSVFILNSLKNIYWDMIKIDIMKKAFKHNDLYMCNDEYELEKINVSKIKAKK